MYFQVNELEDTRGKLLDHLMKITQYPDMKVKTLGKIIGEGGMGKIKMAKDEDDNDICVKFGKAKFKKYLIREAQLLYMLNTLNVPHIPKIFGIDDKGIKFTMTIYNYQTLYDVLVSDEHSTCSYQWEEIIKNLVKAIMGIHKFGVLHNDVKSDNVIVLPENKVVLIDFGLSSFQHGVVLQEFPEGHDWIHPEVRSGQHEMCVASDIYSLGILIQDVVNHLELTEADSLLPSLLSKMINEKLEKICTLGEIIQLLDR